MPDTFHVAPYSLGAAFCVAAPVAFGWSVGDVPAGLVASIGAFTALYGAGRPYNNRALVLAAIAIGLACAVGLGAWSQPFGRLGIATVVLVATCATFFCNALRIGPPGAYMFALAGAVGTGLPTQHLDWWHTGLLVLAGGGISTVVRVAGVLTDTRRPERTAVASAGTAVARFLKSVGGPDEDAARHSSAITLGRIVPISSDVPGFLKEDLEDLSRSLVRQAECPEAASGQAGA